LIGLYTDGAGGDCGTSTANGLDSFVEASGDAPPGTTVSVTSGGGARFPLSAKVALDCVVPNLRGKTLNAAKKALTASSCTLGTVVPHGQTTGTVKSQQPAAGKTLTPGAKVNVRLG
jgi:beta-lactam-binding protein with PASTA domain